MKPPLVSILVPAYNADQYLARTLASATEQTWPRTEIVIVDDGSSDDTLQVAKRFEARNVKICRQDNGGACAARNAALELAQGDYVQWLDADDLLVPDKLERQLARRDGGADSLTLLTSACGSFFHSTAAVRWQRSGLWRDHAPLGWIMTKFIENAWMNPTVWLVSRQLTEAAGPWDHRLALSGDDDGEYIVRLVTLAAGVRFVSDAQCYYRVGVPNSLNWNLGSDSARTDALCLSLELSVGHLLRLADTPATREAALTYLGRWMTNFYGGSGESIARLQNLSRQLGHELPPPRVPWNYVAVEAALGPAATAKVIRTWRQTKQRVNAGFDRRWAALTDSLRRTP